ncbi:MAG: glycosyltransferase family 2 protein [Candidatus Omnitrophica bacterium]|nr:glycosyltransferase family 2 protein [Candidatus Omnitrophota bacterium]MCA9436419.1 glycosyltransferase family 2 protein [Candidatus Omnitrophota bacterium]MCB9768991.1 glycosyltransferase family 2 protein [Candidatus Omnitrophota bacterium]MCB9782409.1 glycosyltransferase family 2 protein [Candidatus Omnitrophota bacterium]
MNPLVSVVLSSYNYENYVADAIRSVFNQTYPHLELVVVDDGSRDNSREVIEETLRESNLPSRMIFKENGGQSSAFNTALEHLNGELVAFIDSDDQWNLNKLEAMVRLFETCPDGGVYQHQVEVGFGGANRLEYIISGDVFRGWEQIGELNLAVYQGRISPFVPTVGLMFRKEILEKVFPIPKELITCPDAYLTRTSVAFGPLYSHPAVLATWRDHEENAGKENTYGYHEYWLPVIMPALNRFYREHGFNVEFYYEAPVEEPVESIVGETESPGIFTRLFSLGRK